MKIGTVVISKSSLFKSTDIDTGFRAVLGKVLYLPSLAIKLGVSPNTAHNFTRHGFLVSSVGS